MFEHDDHRPDDPTGTDALEGGLDIVVSLVTLPFSIIKLGYQFFRWYFLEWIDAP